MEKELEYLLILHEARAEISDKVKCGWSARNFDLAIFSALVEHVFLRNLDLDVALKVSYLT